MQPTELHSSNFLPNDWLSKAKKVKLVPEALLDTERLVIPDQADDSSPSPLKAETYIPDFLKDGGYDALVGLHEEAMSNAQTIYFSSLRNILLNDIVEIKDPSDLPVLLLHKKFDMQQQQD